MKQSLSLKLLATVGLLFLSRYCFAFTPIDWKTCPDNPTFQCGFLIVPTDYKNPGAGTIQLPVTLHKASGHSLGTIVYNYGGPWGDNVSALHHFYNDYSAEIKENFDLATFNPRGVSPNTIECYSDQIDLVHKIDRKYDLTYFNTEKGARTSFEIASKKSALCQYQKNSLYPYVGTKNTVQDMDLLRQALYVDTIDYYGVSYGTRLGLAYLITYPQHVSNMVLDSNHSPDNDFLKFTQDKALAIENALHHSFDLCVAAGNKCPLYRSSSSEIQADFQKLMQEAQTTGIPTSKKYNHRPFTAAMLSNLVFDAIYTSDLWPGHAAAMKQAMISNNADLLMDLYMNEGGINGSEYNPVTNSYKTYDDSGLNLPNIVVCTDYFIPALFQKIESWMQVSDTLRAQNPLLGGQYSSIQSTICTHWLGNSQPLLPNSVLPITQVQPNVLVVGNAYDPGTPLVWSQSVSDYLTKLNVNNTLLAWEGMGHASYHFNAPLNGCVDNNVDNFFMTGKLPVTKICNDQINPFEQNDTHKKIIRKIFPVMKF